MKQVLMMVVVATLLFACKKNKDVVGVKETAVAGSATILVDETIFPIIEDVAILFESQYTRTKINLVSKSEAEILNMINTEKGQIAILAKGLDSTEISYFNKTKKVYPRVTEFGLDAIAFISNKNRVDSTLVLSDVLGFLKGEPNAKIKSLVFDNPNSSTVRTLKMLAGIKDLPNKNIFALKSNKEVVKYVTENEGAIGILGINWLLQPTPDLEAYTKRVQVLAVENVKVNANSRFVKPNQSNIADGSYPVTRKLYMLNFQGTAGLGMGFASYLAGQQGQRIILKSGLVPKHFPTRQIAVRDKVE
ncbi:MAG TPA: substrate-binding domain-containing protein [Flavobacterium sp.]|uniref:PstS family phosphate ABC transporter substrate-binding protein n=1 Tax=Flavobacterium sp. TaxID=239 RepID=UPI002BED94BD|nr:substrate-binding domain-containing protein [Flavobacterium sp.]HSD13347.1 substrate-binding domain-containing protein [Flavobacterium sp.]